MWREYFAKVDGIVYLVDSNDKERLLESRTELANLLAEDALGQCPVLVLGNKIDIPTAASEEELRHYLGLVGVTTGKNNSIRGTNIRPLEIFMCSVVRRQGYGQGFQWLSGYIE